ncbi:MAG TPA: hypothetical protein VK152_12095, partial [Paludibacter sp.]|nr:hypothetical protein [Paludibacter sp.]
MNKIKPQIKKLLKTTFWIVLSVSALFLAIAGIVQIPFVQNKIVNGATAFVSNKTHTSVTINNVGISFPKTVVIVGLFLNDRQKDTLLYAGKTRINISLISLLFNKIAVNSFQLEDMSLNLYNSETDSAFNYNFLLDAFSGDTKTPEKPGKTSWTFDIGNVSLKNIRLHYNDRYGGTDAQLALGKTEINLKNIDPGNSIYEIKNARIENLKARIQLNKTAEWKEDKKEPTGLLPKILADNIRVVNSTVSYTDQATKQLVQATIEYLDLKKGEVDLENEVASIGKLTLRKSKLQYVSNENDTAVTPDTAESPTPQGWDVTINHIAAEHNTVAYDSGNRKSGGNEFDPNHFKFSNVKLDIGKLHYSPNITELNVNNFNASGRQNFSIIRFRTAFRMDNHSVSLRNLSARTLFSSIDANAEIQYSSLKALKESLPYTVLNIDIKDSRFRNSEITYFNPALSKMEFFKNKDNTTSFSGKVQGKL